MRRLLYTYITTRTKRQQTFVHLSCRPKLHFATSSTYQALLVIMESPIAFIKDYLRNRMAWCNYKCNKMTLLSYVIDSLPRWSRGNVLASRSKVRGFKSG